MDLKHQLAGALHETEDEVTYRFDNAGRSLIVEFRTRTYLIHGRTKSGEVSRETYEARGPSHDGLLMRLHLQDAGTVNQAIVPQTIREPYWMTSLDVIPLDQQKQVYVAISFGSRVDETIATKLADFWKQLKASAPALFNTDTPEGEPEDTLEGTLKRHPKFAFRFYLDGLANGQSCGLKGMDELLENVALGSRLRVHGQLRSQHIVRSEDGASAFVSADFIVMQVRGFEITAEPSRSEGDGQ